MNLPLEPLSAKNRLAPDTMKIAGIIQLARNVVQTCTPKIRFGVLDVPAARVEEAAGVKDEDEADQDDAQPVQIDTALRGGLSGHDVVLSVEMQ